MTPEETSPEPSFALNVFGWLAVHPKIAIWVGGFCLWITLCLLFNLWLIQRASFTKKILWSFIILIPFIGWALYGGCFQTPDYNSSPCQESAGLSGGGSV